MPVEWNEGEGERRREECSTMEVQRGERLNDSAVEIGKEFERMINKYGYQVVDGIIPKVTFIMEQLDSVCESNALLRKENQELKFKLIHFERQEKNRKKLEADFEFIESNLMEELLKLREQNCQLKHSTHPHSHFESTKLDSVRSSSSSSNHHPHPSLDSIDSINDFKCEQQRCSSLEEKLNRTECRVKEVSF